ncbi:hypothetical protein LAWI1_G006262, partial [Lachnellula willkommii]
MSSFNQHKTGAESSSPAPPATASAAQPPLLSPHGQPKTIFLTGRNEAKIAPVIQEINAIDSAIDVVFVHMDLGSLESVRGAAAEMLEGGSGV